MQGSVLAYSRCAKEAMHRLPVRHVDCMGCVFTVILSGAVTCRRNAGARDCLAWQSDVLGFHVMVHIHASTKLNFDCFLSLGPDSCQLYKPNILLCFVCRPLFAR